MASKEAAPSKGKNGPNSVGCHQSFRPVLPCGNKLLQQRWDQTYYDEHRKLVRTAKPMVDTKAPPRRNHVVSKWKKEQTLKERGEVINRDNMTLLDKMQKIMCTQGCVDHINPYVHHSLNQEQRQREQVRVARENMDLLKRLEEVEPMYKVSEWIDDWQRKEELANMITSFPDGMPSPNSSSVTPTSTSPRDKATLPKTRCSSKKPASKKGTTSSTPTPTKSTQTVKSKKPSKQKTEKHSKQKSESPTVASSEGDQTPPTSDEAPPSSQEAPKQCIGSAASSTSSAQTHTSSSSTSLQSKSSSTSDKKE